MNLSEKLIHLRKEKKLSQLQLAEILGVSRQAVSKWESGNTMPDITNIIELGRFYHVSLDYLLNCNLNDEDGKDDKVATTEKVGKKLKFDVGKTIINLLIGFILGIYFAKVTRLF